MPIRFKELAHFKRPFDWSVIDKEVAVAGGAVIEGLLDGVEVDAINAAVDDFVSGNNGAVHMKTGVEQFDTILGDHTFRMHGLIENVPATIDLLASEELSGWAERAMEPIASSVLLASGELIQINPGEKAQRAHRDSGGWPDMPRGEHPFVLNAIVAFDDFTLENGATYVVPGSWKWEDSRIAKPEEFGRAVMNRGDALLFRGDSIHHGGENKSDQRRRAISVAYCAGWLRAVENNFLNTSIENARKLPKKLQELIGYAPYDGTSRGGGIIGVYGIDGGDPRRALQ